MKMPSSGVAKKTRNRPSCQRRLGAQTPLPVRRPVVSRERQPVQDVIDEGPVDQVLGVEDREAGQVVEAGGNEVEILPDPDRVRIRIVGVEHGVTVRPVPLVREPQAFLGHFIALALSWVDR